MVGDKDKKNQAIRPNFKAHWAAMMGARIMPNSTCLVAALAAARLLAQHGYKSTLHIGVNRMAGLFAAHAWVEYDGRAIIESTEAPHFTRLMSWAKRARSALRLSWASWSVHLSR